MFSKFICIAAALQACLAVPHGSKRHQHLHTHQAENIAVRSNLGNAIINNNCSYDIWMWPINQNQAGDVVKISAGSQHNAPALACDGCGTSMKISKNDTLAAGFQTQFEYAFAGNKVWYDISLVNCAEGKDASNCPGHPDGLLVEPADVSCPKANCTAGAYCPAQAYYVDQPMVEMGIAEPTFCCDQGVDLVWTVCHDTAANTNDEV